MTIIIIIFIFVNWYFSFLLILNPLTMHILSLMDGEHFMDYKKIEKHKIFLIQAAYFSLIGGLVFLILKYIIPFFAPFLFGFIVAFALKPFSRFLCQKLHFANKFCGAFVVVFTYIVILAILYFIGGRVIDLLKDFSISSVKIYSDYLFPFINNLNNSAVKIVNDLSPNLANQTNEFLNSLTLGIQNSISSMSHSLIMNIAKFGMSLPNLIVGIIFAIMSSIFISSDYNKIACFLSKLFPKKLRPTLFETKGYAIQTIIKYLKAYFILMIITFSEISIGLFLIGASNPIGSAAAIALCDALPLLGTGIVLLPWCLLSFLMGNLSFAIGLIIIYLVVSILRGFLEPKILGKQLGLHPLATLLSVYAGLKFLGVLGMILFPITLQILVRLYKSGHFKLSSL